jgi:outer membrane murein-binding lipoprotein Lpp
MSSPALERKVRQLDNDVQSIYEMLSTISGTQLRQGNRLEEIDQRLESVDSKVDALGGKVDALGGKVDVLAGRVDAVDGKLDSVLGLLCDGAGA